MAPDSNRTAPSVPALIFCLPRTGSLSIASLTVLDRLVVALHRGGCGPIVVVSEGELPSLKASRRLGIPVEQVRQLPELQAAVVVATAAVHVQAADVRAVIAGRGRLVGRAGESLPLGYTSCWKGDLDSSLAEAPPVNAVGIVAAVIDRESAAAVERQLWASLATDTDGVVDKWFNRPVGRYLSMLLIRTPLTPNQITIISMLIGLAGAAFFAQGRRTAGIVGALLLQLSALVDCVDGEVARIVFKESPIGKALDFATDQVVHIAVFLAIAVGVSRRGLDMPALALGFSAVTGALISIPIVIRGRRVAGRTSDRRLDRFIDQASTRDFTALLIFLAIIDRLHWFVWLVGFSVHAFWLVALALQLHLAHRDPPSGDSASA